MVWLSVTLSLSTTGQKRRTLSLQLLQTIKSEKCHDRPGVVDVHGNQVHSSRQRAEETMWSIGGRHKILWLLVVPEHMLGVFSSEAPPKSIDTTPLLRTAGSCNPSPLHVLLCVHRGSYPKILFGNRPSPGGGGDAGKKQNKAIPLFLETIGVLLWPQTELLNTQTKKLFCLLVQPSLQSSIYVNPRK